MKELFLLRGLPGSGKSTLAKSLTSGSGPQYVEADMFFVDKLTGEYKFEPSRLKHAHNWCHDVVENWMEKVVPRIVVSNTFTQEWELDFYFTLAKTYGYTVYCLIVENRHGGVNEHGVPDDKLEEMKNRFSIKL